jgi:glycosyltransferase involved in cell wall biosynthesis
MTISAIITTYKREKLLKICIESIIQNNLSEIIVVNDDPDAEIDCIKTQQQIQIINQPTNAGLCAARNTGIRCASGEFIALCDDDDIWLPGYIESVSRCISQPAAPEMIITISNKYKWMFHTKTISLQNLLQMGFTPPVSAQIYNAKLIKTIGFDERVRNGIDLDLWIRMLRLNPTVTLNFGDYIRQQSHSGPRLTTNLSNRILGLENTLSMWTLEQLLDPRFQKCWPVISTGYHRYLERSFCSILMSDLLRFKMTTFMGRKLNPIRGFSSQLGRAILSKFINKKYPTLG